MHSIRHTRLALVAVAIWLAPTTAAAQRPVTGAPSTPAADSAVQDTAGLGAQRAADLQQRAQERAARGQAPDTSESWDDISAETLAQALERTPVPQSDGGPAILKLQILLDRARFSPGVLDGYWGRNTRLALQAFQRAHGLSVTGEPDDATVARLREVVGRETGTTTYTVTGDDLDGPFVNIPDGPYAKAELNCLCYTGPVELLSERFHTTRELLAQLNPGVSLGALSAGTTLTVPAVEPFRLSELGEADGAAIEVARIEISKSSSWTRAYDAQGQLVAHFPSVLGSQYQPSPSGEFHVQRVAFRPTFHYQPDLFDEVPDSRPDATFPPGPNSPVGVVWMDLSKPHYGIHGTSAPETIGYVTSHGCVRLTNWDAAWLAARVVDDTPVDFVE